jgi:ferredoxin-NADP reductase
VSGKDIAAMVGGGDVIKHCRIFICGPKPMMKALSAQMVELGVPPLEVVFEDFNLI